MINAYGYFSREKQIPNVEKMSYMDIEPTQTLSLNTSTDMHWSDGSCINFHQSKNGVIVCTPRWSYTRRVVPIKN